HIPIMTVSLFCQTFYTSVCFYGFDTTSNVCYNLLHVKFRFVLNYMPQNTKFYLLIVLITIFPQIVGCGNTQKHPELRVFGAMSLTDALTEIGEQFTTKHGVRVSYNFAASSTLQRQIEKGASADVFISASPQQVTALETREMLETGSRYDVLSNRLVLVSHKNAVLSVKTANMLADDAVSRIAIGQPEIVPAGTYAKEALTHLGLWEKAHPKLVFGTDVRATLAYVSAGNVDVAIVYQTDVTLSKNVKILYEFPVEAHSPIVYPAIILRDSNQIPLAQQFIAYLKTPSTTKIFEKHGFTSLTIDSAQ
ncbi:MAG: molybdate ABC transporter substrate-binding protein, partial [Candidatus Poribacteria bacterium]|nr:molybdate ABC transporter substrate-binding protein [Candidatus Poribacteria bacterium]